METEGSRMSGNSYHDLVRAIIGSNLPPTSKVVAIYLVGRADDSGVAWPSLTTISRECRMTRSTVVRNISILTQNGWIDRQITDFKESARRAMRLGADLVGAQCAGGRRKNRPRVGAQCAPTDSMKDLDKGLVVARPILVQSIADDSRNNRPPPNEPPQDGNGFFLVADPPKPKKDRPENLEEVLARGREIGLHPTVCEKFWCHYSANGFKVGKQPMRDWKMALRKWQLGEPTGRPTSAGGGQAGSARVSAPAGKYAHIKRTPL